MSDEASSDPVLPASSGHVNQHRQRRRLLLVGYLAVLSLTVTLGLLQPVIEPDTKRLELSTSSPILGPAGIMLAIISDLAVAAVLVLAVQVRRRRRVDFIWLGLFAFLGFCGVCLVQWHAASTAASVATVIVSLDPPARSFYVADADSDARQATIELTFGLVCGAIGAVAALAELRKSSSTEP